MLLWGLCSALPNFPVWQNVHGMQMSMLALFICVLNLDHYVCLRTRPVTTAPYPSTTPALAFTAPSPPYLFFCVCHCTILFKTSPLLPILPLGRNTEQGWERFPNSHLWILAFPQKRSHANTCCQHMHSSVFVFCVIYILAPVSH